jgi:outer membrane protein TolC
MLRQLQEGLNRQVALAQARLDAGGATRDEYLNARMEAVTGELALADAEAAVARTAAQLEDALQVPFAHQEAVAPPAGPNSPPSP